MSILDFAEFTAAVSRRAEAFASDAAVIVVARHPQMLRLLRLPARSNTRESLGMNLYKVPVTMEWSITVSSTGRRLRSARC
jgi:hypothetical protein